MLFSAGQDGSIRVWSFNQQGEVFVCSVGGAAAGPVTLLVLLVAPRLAAAAAAAAAAAWAWAGSSCQCK
jgi:hypothetical protein